jgi:hypothetical protein
MSISDLRILEGKELMNNFKIGSNLKKSSNGTSIFDLVYTGGSSDSKKYKNMVVKFSLNVEE